MPRLKLAAISDLKAVIGPLFHLLKMEVGPETKGSAQITHGRLFQSGEAIYYLGQSAKLLGSKPQDRSGDLRIIKSLDKGQTWSDSVDLTEGMMWHQSACNVWHANGNVYLVMERRVSTNIKGWYVGELAPILMRAPENSDLTNKKNWTFASELSFDKLLPEFKQNDMSLGLMGIPFYEQTYPNYTTVAPDRYFSVMGWLEANVVQIMDSDHYWYDPAGHSFHLFMRANTGRTSYAAMAKVVENSDGTMTTSLEKAPSGHEILYLPFPGGQMRFHVLYDDLVILSRTAKSAHDGNMITFHRVKNFRNLVY